MVTSNLVPHPEGRPNPPKSDLEGLSIPFNLDYDMIEDPPVIPIKHETAEDLLSTTQS